MPVRLLCLMTVLPFGLWLSGCLPPAEGQTEEQKNGHFRAGKEKIAALEYRAAIVCFERAVRENPSSALAHFEMGVLYDQQLRNFPAALYHYNKALEIRPRGYPADIIRQRLPACQQELVKADSLATINPSALRENERLREDNLRLQQEIASLRAQLAARSQASTPSAAGSAAQARIDRSSPPPAAPPSAYSPASSPRVVAGARVTSLPRVDPTRPPPSPGSRSGRMHSIRDGETAYSISRSYRVRLDALLAANPGVDERRLKVGQTLNIP